MLTAVKISLVLVLIFTTDSLNFSFLLGRMLATAFQIPPRKGIFSMWLVRENPRQQDSERAGEEKQAGGVVTCAAMQRKAKGSIRSPTHIIFVVDDVGGNPRDIH